MARQVSNKKNKANSNEKINISLVKKTASKIASKAIRNKQEEKTTSKPIVKVRSVRAPKELTADSVFNSNRAMGFFGRVSFLSNNQKMFNGIAINKHYKGKVLKNEHGMCYHISDKTKIDIIQPSHDRIKQKLVRDLKVIAGIGEKTESVLKKEGITSISQLTNHYRFGKDAKIYINHVERKNAVKIYEQLSSRFTSSNPLLLSNSAFFDLTDIAFIDIETLGLSEVPLFLIGIATFKQKHLIIDQIFARELNEEKAALEFLGQLLKGKQAIGSFNGKSFDVPFIRKRMLRHDLKHKISLPHFDLKYFSQKAFGKRFSDFKLSTLEKKLFNVVRVDDVPGYDVPYYYTTYLETKNIGTVVPIIDHNKQDLISTAKIFMKLHEIWS